MDDTREAIWLACERWLHQGAKPHRMDEQLAALAAAAPDDPHAVRYGRGAQIAALENEVASLLGTPAAVFMPSGTMAQPIALRIHCDEIGCNRIALHPTSHVLLHEHDGYHELHGLRATMLGEAHRLPEVADLEAIPERLGAVLLELPQREIGGELPDWDDLVAMVQVVRDRGARVHVDGARLWECAPFYDRPLADIAALFDSVYVSFYKTLGGIAGAALAGEEAFIARARIWQRRHGGNLVYQYPFVVAAREALAKRLPDVPGYVARAARVAAVLNGIDGVRVRPAQPRTNLMHVFLRGDKEALEAAALAYAETEKTWLIGRLQACDVPGWWRAEIAIGQTAEAISDEALGRGFRWIVAAGAPS